MIISFKHGGIEYFNYDISDPDTRDFLESQIGRDALEGVIQEWENSQTEPSEREYIAALENQVSELRSTVDILILSALEG